MGGIRQLVPDVSLNKANLINSIDAAVQVNIELKLIHHLNPVYEMNFNQTRWSSERNRGMQEIHVRKKDDVIFLFCVGFL